MVALADWYILPILLQLMKLSGPTIWGFITVGWIFRQWVQLTSMGLSIGSRSVKRWYYFNLLEWCFVYDHTTGQSKMDLNSRANHKTPRGWTKRIYIVIYITVYKEVAILWNLWNYSQIAEWRYFCALSTWSLLCDGRCSVRTVIPFLLSLGEDTVMRVLSGD